MLPTFVIGLREGVEASLIVGIVAAFLHKNGRHDALRWMWLGVAGAIALCVAAAVGLEILNSDLPQRQQEGLETVVAGAAVGMVTFMIVWMRRHAGDLARELRESAAVALEQGSTWALVGMAFFAVVREGLETAVFLLAAFQNSTEPAAAGSGAALGIVVAVGIGYGIYRGGVRLNLGRFFRATAAVLVLVAAGLVASALHTAHEATWLNAGQGAALDLTWLIHPGSVTSSLLTGILGVQPRPTVIEVVGWLVYAVPMLAFVLWPTRWRPRRRAARRGAVVASAIVATALLAVVLSACGSSSSSSAKSGTTVKVELTDGGCRPQPATVPAGPVTFDVTNDGSAKNTEFEVVDAGGKIVAEKEDIASGLNGSFSTTLKAGHYGAQCPDADTPKTALTVSG